MNQTTRNAPFGTDDTPSMTVKIVGGKRVQIAVDQSKLQPKPYNGSLLDLGPSGTPAILTQPDWEAYNTPTPKVASNNKSHETRKVSSYTSPTGDRSYSFKHGVPTINQRILVPPYTSKSTDPFMAPPGSSNKPDAKLGTVSLAAQIGEHLQHYTLQNLKDMYIDLTTFDRQLTGMVGEAQFSVVALRHNLPLKLSLLKLVFAKFIDVRDATMINYEKILQYFSDCIANGRTPSPVQAARSQRSKSVPQNILTSTHTTNQNQRLSTGAHSPQREDQKLVELILAQLAPDEMLELGEVEKALRELDRTYTNVLNAEDIQSECVKRHLPLPMSLITKMLKRAETDPGKANWKHFMEPLISADEIKRRKAGISRRADNSRYSVVPKSDSPGKNGQTPQASEPSVVSSWKQKVAQSREESALSRYGSGHPASRISSGFPSLPSTASSLDREWTRLPDGWDEKEPVPLNALTQSDKMNKLEELLRSFNPSSEDMLLASDGERVTKNFNLIYKLGLSEALIDDAVNRSVLPHKPHSSDDEQYLSVNKLLNLLCRE